MTRRPESAAFLAVLVTALLLIFVADTDPSAVAVIVEVMIAYLIARDPAGGIRGAM